MFSCSSFGIKVGNGLGTALCGLLLDAGGYINGAANQPDSAINMLNFMYLWFPLIAVALTTVVMYFLKLRRLTLTGIRLTEWQNKKSETEIKYMP